MTMVSQIALQLCYWIFIHNIKIFYLNMWKLLVNEPVCCRYNSQLHNQSISSMFLSGISCWEIVDLDWRIDFALRSKHGGRENYPVKITRSKASITVIVVEFLIVVIAAIIAVISFCSIMK